MAETLELPLHPDIRMVLYTGSVGVVGATDLHYPLLEQAVTYYEPAYASWQVQLANEAPGSPAYDALQTDIEAVDLLRAALQLNQTSDPGERGRLGAQFTEIAGRIYGMPDKDSAALMLRKEYSWLQSLHGDHALPQQLVERLLRGYEPLVAAVADWDLSAVRRAAKSETTTLKAYGDALREEYGGAIDLVERAFARKKLVTAANLRTSGIKMLQWLADNAEDARPNDESQARWGSWSAELYDGANIYTDPRPSKLAVYFGRRMAPWHPRHGLGVLSHEILGHVNQSRHAYRTGDLDMAQCDLPNATTAIEGYGTYVEAAVLGEEPQRVIDRFHDITLALAMFGGAQPTRQQLYELSYARQLLRALQAGASQQLLDTLPSKVQTHVDRMYAGGPGDTVPAAHQAILPADATYHAGYTLHARWTAKQLKGKRKRAPSAREVLGYHQLAPIDFTNEKHLAILEEAYRRYLLLGGVAIGGS